VFKRGQRRNLHNCKQNLVVIFVDREQTENKMPPYLASSKFRILKQYCVINSEHVNSVCVFPFPAKSKRTILLECLFCSENAAGLLLKAVDFNLWSRHPEGSWTILEGSRADILCTQMYYICFVRVLDGGRRVIVGRGSNNVWKPLT